MIHDTLKKYHLKGTAIVFILFLLYQLFQHSLVWFYHDDYGYACIHYGYDVGTSGMDYGLLDMCEYLKWHYLNWGGRVLFYFFFIGVIRIGGIWALRIVQAATITAIMFFSYRLVCEKGNDRIIFAVTTVLLFGVPSITVLKDSVYWFSASVSYVWPLLFVFLAMRIACREDQKKNMLHDLTAFLIAFLAGFSQEQVAVFSIVFLLSISYFHKLHQKKINWYLIAGVLMGGALVILAPGNFVRAGEDSNTAFVSLSFVQKLLYNVPHIVNINMGDGNVIFIFVMCITSCMMLWRLYKKYNRTTNIIVAFSVLVNVGYPAMIFCQKFIGRGTILGYGMMSYLWTLNFVLVSLRYCWYFKYETLFCVMLAAFASQAMMVVSPSLNPRSAIIFQLTMIPVIVSVFKQMWEEVNWTVKGKWLFACGYFMFCLVSLGNMVSISRGYYENNIINRANNQTLRVAAEQIRMGKEIESVVFYRLKNDIYAGAMPYDDGTSYIEYWIRDYYGLPGDIAFYYQDLSGEHDDR